MTLFRALRLLTTSRLRESPNLAAPGRNVLIKDCIVRDVKDEFSDRLGVRFDYTTDLFVPDLYQSISIEGCTFEVSFQETRDLHVRTILQRIFQCSRTGIY